MSSDIAARLRKAEANRTAIPPIRGELGEASIDKAYTVQQQNVRFRIEQGDRLVGRKIGLTSLAVQQQLSVNQPDFGMLFDNMEIPDGGQLDFGELVQPKIEAEIAFVLGHDLTDADVTQRDVLSATEYVLPCLEIVDSRIEKWDIGIVDTVADNASSARFVLGSVPRRITDFDFIHCGMVLRANGAIQSTGAGAASLGNPVEAVRWLARTLAEREFPLRAGDVILSGALGPMIPLAPQTNYVSTIAGLGSVAVDVGA